FDVVLTGHRPHSDFLELLLVRLLFVLFPRLFVAVFAVIHDLADRRAVGGGDLDQVQVGLAGHLLGLGGRHDAQLLAAGPDQADGADADLLVHARPQVAGRLSSETVGWGDRGAFFGYR